MTIVYIFFINFNDYAYFLRIIWTQRSLSLTDPFLWSLSLFIAFILEINNAFILLRVAFLERILIIVWKNILFFITFTDSFSIDLIDLVIIYIMIVAAWCFFNILKVYFFTVKVVFSKDLANFINWFNSFNFLKICNFDCTFLNCFCILCIFYTELSLYCSSYL